MAKKAKSKFYIVRNEGDVYGPYTTLADAKVEAGELSDGYDAHETFEVAEVKVTGRIPEQVLNWK